MPECLSSSLHNELGLSQFRWYRTRGQVNWVGFSTRSSLLAPTLAPDSQGSLIGQFSGNGVSIDRNHSLYIGIVTKSTAQVVPRFAEVEY
jgi:hypothetical protein